MEMYRKKDIQGLMEIIETQSSINDKLKELCENKDRQIETLIEDLTFYKNLLAKSMKQTDKAIAVARAKDSTLN
jgi:hypothetical protein